MRLARVGWGAAAAINLAAGLWLSLDPIRSSDLAIVHGWVGEWLRGANPYADPASVTDYPPHALVILAPLGFVSEARIALVWSLLNVGLAVWVAWLAVHAAGDRSAAHVRARRTMVLMLLASGGMRTLNQFTLLALGGALQAVVLARTRPRTAGVWLALALVKPHIGGPFLLWSVLTRSFRTAAVAVALTIGLLLAFCARVGTGPIAVLRSYAEALDRVYLSGEHLTGATELHPLLHAGLSSEAAHVATFAVVAALLALVCAIGARAHRHRRASLEVAALAALWSLLAFRHLSYNLVLMFPALVALRFPERPTRSRAFVAILLPLLVDVPMLWRRGLGTLLPPAAAPAFLHFDRAFVLVVFGCLAARVLGPLRSNRPVDTCC